MPLVGMDARVLSGAPHFGLGVRRYAVRVLEHWARAGVEDVVLFGNYPAETLARFEFAGAFEYRVVAPKVTSGSLWEQVCLPWACRSRGIDVLWSPSYTAPFVAGTARAVVVHDISFDMPEAGNRHAALSFVSRHAARRATLVLTDSEFSKREMLTRWTLDGGRVRVIPLASDPPPKDWRARVPGVLSRLGIEPPFVLFVGTMYSRRCIPTLLEAFARARAARPDATLVLVGRNRTQPLEPIEERVSALNREAGREIVRHFAFVDDDDLPPLYGSAEVFVYLSTLEGFGLPPLEAMSYGTPVISTAYASLAEVTTGGAVQVEPRDVDAVSRALSELLVDREAREQWAARGREQAARFSWARCASETWEALAGLAPAGGRHA
jgi:glycosyltransferase involved in cell wall biosynthesis